MQATSLTPLRLTLRLLAYYTCVVGLVAFLLNFTDWGYRVLPLGGVDLELPGTQREVINSLRSEGGGAEVSWTIRLEAALVLTISLFGTVVLMIPVTWVYMATKFREGYRKAFVEALIVLPICATSIVLLIQDSLPLAFGLAALVAAVRFRVRLRDALDGIYVFAAICVGLASGVGFLGVGVVMSVFFCFASVILWGMDYGANPVETAQQAKKLAKLEKTKTEKAALTMPSAVPPAAPPAMPPPP